LRFGEIRLSGQFPSKEHQFKGGERLGKLRPLIGKRRARKLSTQATVYAAAFGKEPEPEIGSLGEWLRDVVAGRIKPDATQLYAATILQRMGDDALLDDQARTVVNLDTLTADERALLGRLMGKVLPRDGNAPTIDAPALPAPEVDKPAHGVEVYPDAPSDTEALSREVARSQAELLLARRFGRLK
jgi:hypothetical protein